ncbi:succinate dehydrogenase [Candidatus Poribacteria bacterium]|nr:succinate dehydrogenase [Candidatus Poribacteria bacterium]|tara:strand:- start:506 stop:1303 length:798 start_codon:yes stop_codon:yes gene_type:complete
MTELTLIKRKFGETSRSDTWWIQPLVVFCGLSAFIVYTTWAAFQGEHYHHGPYLSPFYAPEIFGNSEHSWFGAKPAWWPSWAPFSPAFLILWAPAGFRLTCYYYRGAYYKAFWADPPSCAVGEPRKGYRGESSFPLILQNVHRFFLYFALVFVLLLAFDVWKAMWFDDGNGGKTFGIGLGTLILAINVFLLSGYTLGCHSLRHLVGGFLDRLSGAPIRRTAYNCVSCLNSQHMRWAWMSLCSVACSDIYIRLSSMMDWTDPRILF